MSAKKARVSKQQPIHMKINLMHYPSSPAPSLHSSFFSQGEVRGLKVSKVKEFELWFIARKAQIAVIKHMRIPRDKKKIHNLYENTAMREYLKRRLRTSNDDLTINRRIEKNWHWVAAEVPELKEKKRGPNKGSRSKKKDLSLQTLFIYLTAFAIFKGYIFHKSFHHFRFSFTFAVLAFY